MSDDDTLAEMAIDSLAHLIAGSDDRKRLVWPRANPKSFDGFELFTPLPGVNDDDYVLLGEANKPPIWPMSVCWATRLDGQTKSVWGDTLPEGWGMKRVSTLDIKSWRGRLRVTLPRMVEHEELFIAHNGQALGSLAPLGLTGSGVVFAAARSHPQASLAVDPTTMYGRDGRETDVSMETQDVSMAHGMMLRREYLWSVLLGEPGIPRARFVTDVAGVRESFRLRDIPPGKQRRAALRHWVRDHWRKNRKRGGEDNAWVRAHLRGSLDFVWNGLSCQIMPSKEDERRNSKAAHDA